MFIKQILLKSYEFSVNTIFEICTKWRGKEAIQLKTIYSLGCTENHKLISVIIPEDYMW